MRAPVRSSAFSCSPRRAKSAAYSDGSISTVRIHSRQATVQQGRLDPESADEEAARSVDMRQREQELRTSGMRELRPFLAERHDFEPAGVDDRLVLVGVDRAYGVDDGPARLHALGGSAEQRELELRQRRRPPAQV